MLTNQIEKNNPTLIFLFISKILPKDFQDLVHFLQKNNFQFKRVTKNLKTPVLTKRVLNSNFFLESNCAVTQENLKILIAFLNKYATINQIFFQNQSLNEERIRNLEGNFGYALWKNFQNQKF